MGLLWRHRLCQVCRLRMPLFGLMVTAMARGSPTSRRSCCLLVAYALLCIPACTRERPPPPCALPEPTSQAVSPTSASHDAEPPSPLPSEPTPIVDAGQTPSPVPELAVSSPETPRVHVGAPVCVRIGTRSEGWSWPDGHFIHWAKCAGKTPACLYARTDQEGYYVGDGLIALAPCSYHHGPRPKP